ncbi:hypothetical protein BN2476_230018 [Paraburkholderia piptadeniae]|uniref:Uncharacterized protein n=1 Tax=Paraburkholderia piptadeniae TaxID=1701573 RepID=A0A1N7RWH1_9BURK|nr:hypothetical protein BN2476_230018 [Paraburkholderia piptadeniae]
MESKSSLGRADFKSAYSLALLGTYCNVHSVSVFMKGRSHETLTVMTDCCVHVASFICMLVIDVLFLIAVGTTASCMTGSLVYHDSVFNLNSSRNPPPGGAHHWKHRNLCRLA